MKLVSQKDRALHKKAGRVEDFKRPGLKRLVLRMKRIMKEKNGIGLAAPQVRKSLQVFVIDEDFIKESRDEKHTSKIRQVIKKILRKKLHDIFINPEVISVSKKGFFLEEGCLSIPGVFGIVPRAKEVSVVAQNEYGKKFTVKADGLYAHVLQHEIDHLNGILFTKKAVRGSLHRVAKRQDGK